MEDAMTRKGKPTITQEEISVALARFLKHGGVIEKLPAQEFHAVGTVGGEKYEAYESLADLPTLASPSDRVA
jgi:hypothetical protein